MHSITVKNIPPEVYEKLKSSAKANRRSINREIITIIEQAVQSKPLLPEDLLAQARQLREKTTGYTITDEEFKRAKESGRL